MGGDGGDGAERREVNGGPDPHRLLRACLPLPLRGSLSAYLIAHLSRETCHFEPAYRQAGGARNPLERQ